MCYRRFHALMYAVTKALHGQGLRAGDVVGVSMGQTPLHCAALLALARLGALSVAVHPELSEPLRALTIAQFGVSRIVTQNAAPGVAGTAAIALSDVLADVMGRDLAIDWETGYPAAMAAELDAELAHCALQASTPLRISLTSGTSTGKPKGDLLSHAQLIERIERTLHGCDCDGGARVMPSDLNSTMAIALSFGALSMGACVVFPVSAHARDRIDALASHAVTHAFLSQWAITQMLALMPEHPDPFPSLRHLRPVGSRLSGGVLEALQRRCTKQVFVTYGLTELGPVAMATPQMLERWPHTAGAILPWVSLTVHDAAGQPMPPGQSGAIRVQIARTATQYHADPHESAKRFRDGWFETGDLGHLSTDGLLFIEGRLDDVINLDGYKINPAAVETVLVAHPQVAEAVVFSARDDAGAAYLSAALVLRGGPFELAALADYAAAQLGRSSPKRYVVVPSLARTPSGKPLRAEIAALALSAPPQP